MRRKINMRGRIKMLRAEEELFRRIIKELKKK